MDKSFESLPVFNVFIVLRYLNKANQSSSFLHNLHLRKFRSWKWKHSNRGIASSGILFKIDPLQKDFLFHESINYTRIFLYNKQSDTPALSTTQVFLHGSVRPKPQCREPPPYPLHEKSRIAKFTHLTLITRISSSQNVRNSPQRENSKSASLAPNLRSPQRIEPSWKRPNWQVWKQKRPGYLQVCSPRRTEDWKKMGLSTEPGKLQQVRYHATCVFHWTYWGLAHSHF